jgi:O-antigen/teichoic acid export membrane protein
MPEQLSIIGALRHPISLNSQAARATAWTFGSFGISQILRIASHLVLTRLLAPEMFGLMLIIDILFHAMAMFSDFGVGPSIVQNKKGGEPRFLQTAWTVGLLLSIGRWVIAAACAWPMARYYDEPMLMVLIPVVAFSGVIDGFTSTQVDALERKLELKRVVILDLGSYILSLVVMIGAAWYWRSVWALVAGGMTYSLVSTILTHLVLGGPRMKFKLDREILGELFHFGKWLFLSSILTFLTDRLDDIVLTKYMSMAELGMYGIAISLAYYMSGITSYFSKSILFPKFSRAAEEDDDEKFRGLILKARLFVMFVFLPPIWLQIIFADEIIALLYDTRYAEAAWMFRYMSFGAIFITMFSPLDHLLLVEGDTYRHMTLEFVYMVVLTVAMIVGGHFWGVQGIVAGSVSTGFLIYPYLARIQREYGVWMPGLDFGGAAVSAIMISFGFWVFH